MQNRIGSLGWARQTHGALSVSEKIGMANQAFVVQLKSLVEMFRQHAPDFDQSLLESVRRDIELPGSKLVAGALGFVDKTLPPWLFNHTLRTWCWGVIFSKLDNVSFDRELLALSALFHDTGLLRDPTLVNCTCCFTVQGGLNARGFLNDEGASPDLIENVENAICLHMNVSADLSQGPEAYLLHEAAAFDVVGSRFKAIPPNAISLVLNQYARGAFSDEMQQAMRAEAHLFRQGRVSLLWKLGFKRAILQSAWKTNQSTTSAIMTMVTRCFHSGGEVFCCPLHGDCCQDFRGQAIECVFP